jgi:hypothetical protein
MTKHARTRVIAAIILLWASAWPTFGQQPGVQPLALGATRKGVAGPDQPAAFRFEAGSAGLLTVAIRGMGSADLYLIVADEEGQALPEGTSDNDLGGSGGAEQLAIALPAAGTYTVRVQTRGSGEGGFIIGASWLPFAELAAAPDPDGRPRGARDLVVGKALDDSLNFPGGDVRDWFVVAASSAGTLVIVTRGAGGGEGDLVLEAFAGGDYGSPVTQSDQDLQGDRKSESITLPVKPGDKLYIRVSIRSSQGPVPYRLSAGLVPE